MPAGRNLARPAKARISTLVDAVAPITQDAENLLLSLLASIYRCCTEMKNVRGIAFSMLRCCLRDQCSTLGGHQQGSAATTKLFADHFFVVVVGASST
ncbi:hypothetical protein MLPF_2703 [Mycobacterium lepromatosis]|nr:hypothetical protein MLPF_2703 [Mycobacterium lepromatosis]